MPKGRKRKKCALCDTLPSYGFEEGRPTHCASHRPDGAADMRSKRCAGVGGSACPTRERAYYGDHCKYCTTDEAAVARYRRAEKRCLKEISKRMPACASVAENFRVEFACSGYGGSRAFVDAVIDHPSVRVLLEIDECRHGSYPPSCESKRMHAVVAELRLQSADTRPIAWVRFNPDDGEEPARARDQKRRCVDAARAIRDLFESPRDDIVYVNYG